MLSFCISLFTKYIMPFVTIKLPILANKLTNLLLFLRGKIVHNIKEIFTFCVNELLGITSRIIKNYQNVNLQDELYTLKDNIVYKTTQKTSTFFSDLPQDIQRELFNKNEVVIDQYSELKSKVQEKL